MFFENFKRNQKNPEKQTKNDLDGMTDAFLKYNSFLLICHVKPDGDALGSAVALGLCLKKLKKNVIYYAQKPFSSNLNYMNELNCFMQDSPNPDDYDMIVFLDCSNPNYAYLPENTDTSKPCAVVDHHLRNPGFGTWDFIKVVAATGQLVFEVIRNLEQKTCKQLLDADISIALFTSISSDTGSFQYPNVTVDTHRIVCELYNFVSSFAVYSHSLHREKTRDQMDMCVKAIESIETECDGKLVFVTVDYDTYSKYTEKEPISNSISHIGSDLKGCRMAATFKEVKPSVYKVSLRSNLPDGPDVSIFSVEMGGGGHYRASGFTYEGPLDILKRKMIDFFEKS